MTIRSFEYYAPRSLKEVLSLLEKRGEEAKVLAGGTDLIVQMKDGRARPAVIVDVKKIPELNRLEWNDSKSLYIGAAVPLSKIVTFLLSCGHSQNGLHNFIIARAAAEVTGDSLPHLSFRGMGI